MALHAEFSPVWSCLLHNSLLWFHGGLWFRSGLFLLGGRGGTAALGAVVGRAGVAALPLTAHGRRPPPRGGRAGLASGERQGTQSSGTPQPRAPAPRDTQHCLQLSNAHSTALSAADWQTDKLKCQTKIPTPSKLKLTKPGTDKPLKTTALSELLWLTCSSCSAVGQARLLQ